MLDIRPLNANDIRYVVYRMWRRGVEEIRKNGDIGNEEIIKAFQACNHEYGYAIYFEDRPVAIFGAHAIDPLTYHTYFSATDKFHHIGRHATRFMRQLVLRETAAKPRVKLEIWSGVDHPEAERWFGLLGFDRLPDKERFQHYVYNREKGLTVKPKSTNIDG